MRKLTVSALFRQQQNTIVPSIRLNGKWLAQIVQPGAKVRVTVKGSTLVIEPEQ